MAIAGFGITENSQTGAIEKRGKKALGEKVVTVR